LAEAKQNLLPRVGLVQEEADETAFWLELIIEGVFLKAGLVQPLLIEAEELTKIMAKSKISAVRKLNRQSSIVNRQ
jgi:hypothetical protein